MKSGLKCLAKFAMSCEFLQMTQSEVDIIGAILTMFEDNPGEIFLAGNRQASKRTK